MLDWVGGKLTRIRSLFRSQNFGQLKFGDVNIEGSGRKEKLICVNNEKEIVEKNLEEEEND